MSKRFVNPALFGPWCLVLLMLLILRLSTPAQAQPKVLPAPAPKRVLLLYTYGDGLPAYQKATPAFLSLMEATGMNINDLFFEYLDLQRNNKAEYRQRLADLLRYKYAKHQVGLIVTVHTDALNFLLDEAKGLFPDAPIFSYLLVRPELIEAKNTGRRILLRPQNLDMRGTLEIALKMFPQTQKIVFVTGTAEGDRRLEHEAKRAFGPWRDKLEFQYTSDRSVEEILRLVASLPSRSIVIYCNVFSDRTGRIFIPREVGKMVAKAANAPVFCLWDTLMGSGSIGGSLLSFEAEGAYAANVVLDILNGKTSLTKPVTTLPTTKTYMFDSQQLKRWRVNENILPEGSVLVNRVPTMWEQHKGLVVGGIAAFLAQTVLVIALLIQRRRKKVAEESLSQKTEELNQFFNVSLDLLCIANTDGYFLHLNPAWERVFGHTREELMARQFLDFVHPDDLDKTREAVFTLVSQQKVFYFENRYRCKDGTYRWLQWSSVLAGNRIYAAARDITEKKRGEEALEERLRFEELLSNISSRFVNIPPDRVDPEIGQSLKQIIDFFKVDRCALLQILADETSWQITHVAAQESVPPVPQGTTLPVSINPWAYDKLIRKQEVLSVSRIDDLPAEANVDKQTWNEWGIRSNLNIPIILGGPVNHVFAINSVKSEQVWPKESIPRLRLLGEIFVNALERKRAEQKAYDAHRELTRMERLSRMGELSASLSHELNQPLTAILSNASAALRFLEAGKLDPAELVEILQDIVKDDKRAGDIIRNLRAMVKPEEGEQELISINGVLRETVALFRSEAIIRNIRVEIDLADPLPLLYVTKVQIQQVLINLMMNAAESMTGDEYAEKVIVLQTAASGEGVVKVAVRDFGPGIEEQALERIFDPFFTTKRSGLGMGLSLSRSIIESHGGHIWAENNPDKGITFYFDLPGVKNEGRRVPGVE